MTPRDRDEPMTETPNDQLREDAARKMQVAGANPVAITVMVPVYNEEDNLPHLYERLTTALRDYGQSYELLFIDDGSQDRSFQLLRELHARDPAVRVVRFVRNFGQQMANTAGLNHARGEAVVLIDADLQTQPEEIPLLVNKLHEGYDIVYGIRRDRNDPLLRRIGSWVVTRLLYRMTDINVPDSSSGFIALDRKFVQYINLYNERSKYLNGLFAWLSYGRYAAVPITHSARARGTSKYSIPKLVHLTLDFICSFSNSPLRVPTYLGLALLGVSGLALLLSAAVVLFTAAGALWLLFSALAVLSAVQLLCIGILGVYISRIYTEVKQRPTYVVREVLDHDEAAPAARAGT